MNSAGGSHKKRQGVVRKESAETLEYESCQHSDVDVDRDESLEELNFTQEVQQRGLKFLDVAATLVEDDGKPHTINICENCYSLRPAERKETKVTHARCKVASSKGCGNDIVKKLWARKLWEEARRAVQLVKNGQKSHCTRRGLSCFV